MLKRGFKENLASLWARSGRLFERPSRNDSLIAVCKSDKNIARSAPYAGHGDDIAMKASPSIVSLTRSSSVSIGLPYYKPAIAKWFWLGQLEIPTFALCKFRSRPRSISVRMRTFHLSLLSLKLFACSTIRYRSNSRSNLG